MYSSINLIKNFAEYGGKKIVCSGTCAEYDWDYGYCSELLTPLKPNSLYGKCKNSLQNIMVSYCNQNNVEFIWGRIFFMFGENEPESKLIAYVINSLIKNQKAFCSKGTQIRDFLHVKDVASIFLKLLLDDHKFNGAINICSGSGISIRDLVQKIGLFMDKSQLIEFSDIEPPLNDPSLIIGDNSILNRTLNLEMDHDLDNRILETINWWENKIVF